MAGLLDTVVGALGLSGKDGPDKLKIESWSDIKRTETADPAFTFAAFINPDEFTINYNVFVESSDSKTPGANANLGKFLGTAPLELTLKFFLDGTGVTGTECVVPEQIKQFYKTVGYDEEGKKHSIRYLRITWGSLTILRSNQFALECILKSASLQYKLFDKQGLPLRVIISATFTEALSDQIVAAEFLKHSPDLTHVRIAKEGDTLPGMVYKIYGDLKYYMEVARINKLINFRNLSPGQKIIFPPFDKKPK